MRVVAGESRCRLKTGGNSFPTGNGFSWKSFSGMAYTSLRGDESLLSVSVGCGANCCHSSRKIEVVCFSLSLIVISVSWRDEAPGVTCGEFISIMETGCLKRWNCYWKILKGINQPSKEGKWNSRDNACIWRIQLSDWKLWLSLR